jgi:YVTN family beta-propeller protein
MDDLCFDQKRRRLYVISGHGTVTVIDVSTRQQLAAIGTVETSVGARTACWDASRDALYVACPATGCAPARLMVYHAS